jgi:hypothetical protein
MTGMKRKVRSVASLAAVAVVVSAVSVGAAFKKEEKSKMKMGGPMGKIMGMFAGKQMREGIVTTVAVKGDRKLSRTGDLGQLVDLAAEKIYDIDFKKKTYSVMTFEQMRQKLKEQQEKLEKQMAEMKAEQEKNKGEKMPEYDFSISSKATGEAKAINGFQTKQVITTITMTPKGQTAEQGGAMSMTIDQWLAPTLEGSKEEADFEIRYMKALGTFDMAQEMAQAAAMYPGMIDMMRRAKVEGAKIEGTPVYSVTTFDSIMSPEQQKAQEQQSAEGDSGGGGGLSGMFARKMFKKKKAEEPAAEGGDAASKGKVAFMTVTTEVLSASTNVTDADLAVPEGFKQKD